MSVKYEWLWLSLGFWFLHCLFDFKSSLIVFSLFGFFLYFRFKKIWVLGLWCLFYLIYALNLPQEKPLLHEKTYTIQEIRSSYCIAGDKKGNKLLIYGLENPAFFDTLQISSKQIEPISSLENLNLFSWKNYMNKQQIYYQTRSTDKNIIQHSSSIKARLFRRLSKNPVYLKVFYNFNKDESFFQSMSLGLIGFLSLLKKNIKNTMLSLFWICIVSILYGYLFVFSAGLVRFILWQILSVLPIKKIFKVSLFVFCFTLLFPHDAFNMAFVLPSAMLLTDLFSTESNKIFLKRSLLIFFQMCYFSSINVFTLLSYSFLLKIWGIYFIYCCLSLFLPYEPFWPEKAVSLFEWHWSVSYLFIFIFLLFFFRLLYTSSFKYKIRMTALLLGLCLFPYLDPFFHVYFLNIGQGDCALIVEPFKKSAVMIDCGQNLYRDNVETIIYPFLQSLHIRKIDALILTHDDFDHSGGKESLEKKIEIGEIITSPLKEPKVSYSFHSLLQTRKAKDENDQSILCHIQYDEFSYLFTGDASVDIEKQMMESYEPLDCDVLKVGHHGSKTSSSYEFIDWLAPKIGIISVGKNNKYHHPSPEVLDTFEDLGVNVLQTKDMGMIHLFTFHNRMFLQSANGYISCIIKNTD